MGKRRRRQRGLQARLLGQERARFMRENPSALWRGGRPWTQKDGKAVASRKAARGRSWKGDRDG